MTVCAGDQEYKIGNEPLLIGTFVNEVDALADPTTVVFRIKAVSTGVIVTYTFGVDGNVTHPSTGIYKCRLPVLTVSDRYKVSVTGTGTVNAADYDEFTVPPAL